ncbi:AraC family ligand binding domain-containing protein, partial [Aquibium sp. A9E412]|uniref:AraC family ligand binding domain-containing protein n=1 Tax=Aquibium sp. A9E412 TaxID=2976767 RepID=UPI0025B219E1
MDDARTSDPGPAGCGPPQWRYRVAGGIEEAHLVATGPAGLAVHVHAETQVTLVKAGTRAFATAHGVLRAGPGEAVVLPAGLAHRGLAAAAGTESVNIYLPGDAAGAAAFGAAAGRVVALPGLHGAADPTALAMALADRVAAAAADDACRAEAAALIGALSAAGGRVGAAARAAGLTREGF